MYFGVNSFFMAGRVLLAYITSRAPDMKTMGWREFWHFYFFSSHSFFFDYFFFSSTRRNLGGGIITLWSIVANGMPFVLFFIFSSNISSQDTCNFFFLPSTDLNGWIENKARRIFAKKTNNNKNNNKYDSRVNFKPFLVSNLLSSCF